MVGLVLFIGIASGVEFVFGIREAVRMSPLAAIAVAAIPGLLWLYYFHEKDRYEPEPVHLVFGVYLLGAFVAGPLAQFVIGQAAPLIPLSARSLSPLAFDRVVFALLIVGVAQEVLKYATVRYSIYLSAEFDEPVDGIVYMTAVGTGFATWENYHYFQGLDHQVFLSTGAAHAVVTTLAHACFAGVMGYFLGRAKFIAETTARRAITLVIGLVAASLLSGGFHLVETMVSTSGMGTAPWRGVAWAAGFTLAVFLVISVLMRRLLDVSPFREDSSAEPGAEAAP